MGYNAEIREFFEDESGVVIIFKNQINKLLETIFKQINSQSKEVYS